MNSSYLGSSDLTAESLSESCRYFDCAGCDACKHVASGAEVSTARDSNPEKAGANAGATPNASVLPAAGNSLSPREAEILTLMAEFGCTAKEVAHKFGVSYRTVEFQVASAIAKLGARNRMQAVVLWDRRSRLTPIPA